ncbi:MAG: hypothetical protein ACOYM2_01800 [Rectinemataceae bacterium]
MMDCAAVASLVDAWESEGEVASSSFETFREHLAGCEDCSRRFGAILPFMARDAGAVEFIGADRATATDDGASADRDLAFALLSSRRGGGRGKILSLVSAAAILVVGLGLGITLGRSGGSGSDRVSVQFTLAYPEATAVSLVGDFNGWKPGQAVMTRSAADQPWEIKITLPQGHMYTYNFLVDGKYWVSDPQASEAVNDGFGGTNSLLRL